MPFATPYKEVVPVRQKSIFPLSLLSLSIIAVVHSQHTLLTVTTTNLFVYSSPRQNTCDYLLSVKELTTSTMLYCTNTDPKQLLWQKCVNVNTHEASKKHLHL